MTSNVTPTMLPTTIDQTWKLATLFADSDMVPKIYQQSPSNTFVAIMHGLELGLPPLAALQNIAVINNRPAIFGDALIGLVRASSLCESIVETFDEKTMTATCTTKRADQSEVVEASFSQADAKKANLYKSTVWASYEKRMLKMRARAYCLRDAYPDVLKGLRIAEEVNDYQPMEPAIQVKAETTMPKMPKRIDNIMDKSTALLNRLEEQPEERPEERPEDQPKKPDKKYITLFEQILAAKTIEELKELVPSIKSVEEDKRPALKAAYSGQQKKLNPEKIR